MEALNTKKTQTPAKTVIQSTFKIIGELIAT